MLQRPFIIQPHDPPDHFPDPALAMREPNGLLAAGGDLSPERVLAAYRRGIFPWYNEGEPVLWWSPDPRCVFVPGTMHVPRRLARLLRQGRFEITLNTAFERVIDGCAAPRGYTHATWITGAMRRAYTALHAQGHAHSVEAWQDGELAGGLYGLGLGRAFFGESMFSRQRDASKAILAHLDAWLENHKFGLIDCQVESPHLLRLGAQRWPRQKFLRQIARLCRIPAPPTLWKSGRKLLYARGNDALQ